MLLSRSWFLIVALAAGSAVLFALASQAAFNRQYDNALEDSLRRDRIELDRELQLDARNRLYTISAFAINADLRAALREANGRRDRTVIEPALRQRATGALQSVNRSLEELAADILFAVDRRGDIVAATGDENLPAGAGLGAFPLVELALRGYVRDDVWVYNEAVYRMAARPVVEGGEYVGAIVHGKRFDDDLCRRLSERLNGATIAFFLRERVIAAHMPSLSGAPRREELGQPLAAALADARLQDGGRTDPVPLGNGGRAVYSLVTGGAAHAGVGYAIGRPRPHLESPLQVFDQVAKNDYVAVLWPTGAIVLAGVLLVFAIAMLFVWLESDRPLSRLRRATLDLSRKSVDRLSAADFGGRLRKIALQVNEAIERMGDGSTTAAPARRAANLDEVLGPTPGNEPAPFFGFADNQGGGQPSDFPSAPPPPQPTSRGKPAAMKGPGARIGGPPPPPPPPGGGARPGLAPPVGPSPAGLFGGARPLGSLGSGAHPGSPGGGAFGPPAMSPPMGVPRPVPGATGKGRAVPTAGQARAVTHSPPVLGSFAPPGQDDSAPPPAGEEMPTEIASIPAALLAAAGRGPVRKNTGEGSTTTGGAGPAADPETVHFSEVFEQFVAAKKQCGEPTTGLTLDRFLPTLRKNRDQILTRHGAKSVRFTVYVKDGKAALKATPVKD